MGDLDISVLANLFDHLPLGLVVLSPAGEVVVYNRAEELLAGRERSTVLGRDFFLDIAPCMNVRQLGGAFREKIGTDRLDVSVEFAFPFPFLAEPRDVHVRMSSFDVAGQAHGLLTIEDVSFRRSVDRMRETLNNLLIHDLKNPLAAISANLGFLEGLVVLRDAQDAKEAIADSLEAATRLQSMLLNLLDVTRLETNTLPLRREKRDARALLRAVASSAHGSARAQGSEVLAEASSLEMLCVFDGDVLRRALDNLVENAIRHAKHVTLGAVREGGTTVLEVRDDGPGVPLALRTSIFEKHVQVTEHAEQQQAHNRGLGLTFVRLAARAHGGDATVVCPPGGGSVFRISLPDLPVTQSAPPKAAA